MRSMLTARLLVLMLLAAALAPMAASAQQKIGVVDISRALSETEDGRKAKAKLKELFDSRQKSLDDKRKELMTMKEGIDKQANVLSREVLAQKSQALQKAFTDLQSTYMNFQKELAAKEEELTAGILERMQEIVKRIGQKEGYALVLDRASAGVVYVPSSYDLTDVLIQEYNAGSKKKKGGKKK